MMKGVCRQFAAGLGSTQPSAPTGRHCAIFRDELPDGSAGPEMIVIPTGTFLMGSSQDEGRFAGVDRVIRCR
jgi:formylglycine-generating enzyme required for sulfatase activity